MPSGLGRRGDGVTVATRETWLDGNAIAGMLQELLGAEMTGSPRRCQSCGEVHLIGAHRLYRGAGLVLRCPHCGDVAAQIATLESAFVVKLSGSWQMVIPR